MESEKVKEIKKALECCSKGECGVWCPRFDKKNINHTCQDDMNADALILINELESENERLTKQCTDWQDLYRENTKRHSKPKDRIADLEKENEILQGTKDRLTFVDRIKIADNSRVVALKQFAEKIKSLFVEDDEVIAEIDETLKEVLGEKE